MKVFVKSLWGSDSRPLWETPEQREALRSYLNNEGFYVLTGLGDSLEVYAIDYTEPIDVRCAKNILAKLKKSWYIELKGGN